MASFDDCISEDFTVVGATAVPPGSTLERNHEVIALPASCVAVPAPMSTAELRAEKARYDALFEKLGTRTATAQDRADMEECICRMESAVHVSTKTRKAEDAAIRARYRAAKRAVDVQGILRLAAAADSVMLCFLVDCTSSMTKSIEAVKRDVRQIVAEMRRKSATGALRVAFVGYRDFVDRVRLEVMDFTKDIGAFETFLAGMQAIGGGDPAEDVVGGLRAAAELSWTGAGKGTTRVLVHIADSPGHGQRYNGGVKDDYACKLPPGGRAAVDPLPWLMALRNVEVQYFFGELTNFTRKMIRVFNEDMGGPEPFISTATLDAAKLLPTVTGMLDSSVMKTASKASARKTNFASKDFKSGLHQATAHEVALPTMAETDADEEGDGATRLPEPRAPDDSAFPWRAQRKLHTEVLSNAPIRTLRELQRRTSVSFGPAEPADGATTSEVVARIAPQSFAEGGCRWAYRAQLLQKRGTWHLGLPFLRPGAPWQGEYVVKRFKGPVGHIQRRYREQIESSTVAAFLATEFNMWSHRPTGCKPVHFLKSHVLNVYVHGRASAPELYTAERPLPVTTGTPFVKFSDNTGHWQDGRLHHTLMHFSAYTFQATGQYIMVVDLQGVETATGYYLTDPVILCRDLDRFGDTNLGEQAMRRCMVGIDANLSAV